MPQLNLEFLTNEANESEGLNDPGIETYTDEPYASTARECGQNSADAVQEPPVMINFDRLSIAAADLGACDTLRAAVSSCLLQAKRTPDEKAIDFMGNAIELLSRIYWFTVEFGLIQENGGLRIYGAGILSSKGETQYSLHDPKPARYPFDVSHILNTPYRKDEYQKEYFIITGFDQLSACIPELDRVLKEMVRKAS